MKWKGFLAIFLIVLTFFTPSLAAVEWNIQKTLKIDGSPIDAAVSVNGKWIFVLTEQGNILIYSPNGQLKDKIKVGNHVNQIQAGPREDILILNSRKNKTLDILIVDFLQEINISGSPCKGAADAPVVIAVFTDFQCSYCARLVPVLEQVLEKNPGEVRIVFKNFPLSSHKYASKAAIAALVADSQGKFWDFHDQLFINYDELSDQKIRDIARELGFNEAEFEKQMKDPRMPARIRQDIGDGTRSGVNGTPTVFINGRRLRNQSREGFQVLIDQELEKIQGGKG